MERNTNKGGKSSLTKILTGTPQDAVADVLVNFGELAINPLMDILEDPDINVRYSAVRALGKLKAKKAASKIINLFNKETDPRFRGCIVVSLAQIGTDEVRKPIILAYEEEKDDRVRCLIVTAIGILCDDSSLAILKKALKDTDARVRANAVEAIARIKGLNPSEFIKQLLKDPNNRVRANVCKVLWHSDPETVFNSLKEMIESEKEMERASAAYAMGEIADKRILELLVERLKVEKASQPREHICEALGKIGELAMKPLKEVLALENNLNVLFAIQEINRKKRRERKI
ncbi:HEAT repeat domain-containing protein [Candidatus Riflebacteria bacterium]